MGGVPAEGAVEADGPDVGITGMVGFVTLDDFKVDDGVGDVNDTVFTFVVEVERSVRKRHCLF